MNPNSPFLKLSLNLLSLPQALAQQHTSYSLAGLIQTEELREACLNCPTGIQHTC